MQTPKLKNTNECTGCRACIVSCPKNAISMSRVGFDANFPSIDETKCISCRKCEEVCHYQPTQPRLIDRAYVVVNTDADMLQKSASGGAFSALAKTTLLNGGVVFGANMTVCDGKVVVKHICVETIEELPQILGSKYVQSDCSDAFMQIKNLLQTGKQILFGGTSCQVKSLYSYLKNMDVSNLYTADLICHGVPSVHLLNNYVSFLEEKYKGVLQDIGFRTKRQGEIVYQISATLKSNRNKKERTITIPLRRSSYYRMFMAAESYQEGCYHCEYASVAKPADITLGDYFEIKDDYPELLSGKAPLHIDYGVSAAITHTEKGENLLQKTQDSIQCIEVDCGKVVRSHKQLQQPSTFRDREKLLTIYRKKGFAGIEKFYFTKNLLDWKENISIIVGRENIKRLKNLLKR